MAEHVTAGAGVASAGGDELAGFDPDATDDVRSLTTTDELPPLVGDLGDAFLGLDGFGDDYVAGEIYSCSDASLPDASEATSDAFVVPFAAETGVDAPGSDAYVADGWSEDERGEDDDADGGDEVDEAGEDDEERGGDGECTGRSAVEAKTVDRDCDDAEAAAERGVAGRAYAAACKNAAGTGADPGAAGSSGVNDP